MQSHEARQHINHGWEKMSTDHIHKVKFIDTHFLMKCSCNFYGWAEKELVDGT